MGGAHPCSLSYNARYPFLIYALNTIFLSVTDGYLFHRQTRHASPYRCLGYLERLLQKQVASDWTESLSFTAPQLVRKDRRRRRRRRMMMRVVGKKYIRSRSSQGTNGTEAGKGGSEFDRPGWTRTGLHRIALHRVTWHGMAWHIACPTFFNPESR